MAKGYVTFKLHYMEDPFRLHLTIPTTKPNQSKQEQLMHVNNNDPYLALEALDLNVDRLTGLTSIDDYVESLNQPHTGTYLVRPNGCVEFFKS